MFKITQPMPELTGPKYEAFKKTMNAAKVKEDKELASIRRTLSTLRLEGPKIVDKKSFIPGQTPSPKGGRSRRRRKSRKKRRKRKTKRRKSRKKRRKSRRKRRR